MGEWFNKLVYSYHEILLSNKRNEMMMNATISIDLKIELR